MGNPDLIAWPQSLELEPACPGGVRRASLLLENRSRWDVDAMAGGTRGVEAYPSAIEVDGHGSSELAVVIHVPETTAGRVSGLIVVRHRREGASEESDPLHVPWSADVVPGGAEATVLCGGVLPCDAIDFGPVFTGAVWARPIDVVNDGCAPLRVERVVAEGSEVEVAGPALPRTLQPGERWAGTLRLDPASAGTRQGTVVVETDDPARPQRQIGWTAAVR